MSVDFPPGKKEGKSDFSVPSVLHPVVGVFLRVIIQNPKIKVFPHLLFV